MIGALKYVCQKSKKYGITVRCIGGTLKLITALIGCIFNVLVAKGSCIVTYGKTITDPSRMGFMFTTWTKMLGTMIYQTLLFFQVRIIYQSTAKRSFCATSPTDLKIWIKSEKKHRNGTEVMKAGRGIVNMQKNNNHPGSCGTKL